MPTMPFRRAFAAAVATLLLPLASFAASPGDLVKLADDGNPDTTSDSAVYYVGGDGKRYAFPNSQAYFTWYGDFNGVKIVSAAEMAAMPLGGNVTYRPGTRLVKITSDPSVYAVEPGGSLRQIPSEEVAKALYGDAWSKRVDDVPDAFFFNYRIGAPLAAATFPSGSFVKGPDGSVWRIENGVRRKFATADVRKALRVRDEHLLTGTSASLDPLPVGADIATAEQTVGDTAQKTLVEPTGVQSIGVRIPASSYFVVGGTASLLDLKLSGPKAMTVRKLTVKVEATTKDGTPLDGAGDTDVGGFINGNNARRNLTQFRFRDDAGTEPFRAIDPALDFSGDDAQKFVFEGSYGVPAGTERVLSLVAQSDKLLPTGEGYKVTLVRAESLIVDESGQPAALVPGGDIVGPTLTSLNESVILAAPAKAATNTIVRGSNGIEVSSFTVKATTVAPNVVTAVSLQGYVDEEGTGGYVPGSDADNGSPTHVKDVASAAYLYDDAGGKLAGPVAPDAGGKVTFSGLHFVIPAGGSAGLHVRIDIPKTLEVEAVPTAIAFDVASVDDLKATDEKGAPVTVSAPNPNGGIKPITWLKVAKSGGFTATWTGAKDAALVSTEVLLGTVKLAAANDSYALKTLSFATEGAIASLGTVRLEYPTKDGAVSKSGEILGGKLTFSGLPIEVAAGATAELKLYGRIKDKGMGSVSGEILKIATTTSGPWTFVSTLTGETYDVSAFGTAGFSVSGAAATSPVRNTILTFKQYQAAPGLTYREAESPMLYFSVQAAATGSAWISKMVFDVTPGDVVTGEFPEPSLALSKWAAINGDFADDNDVVSLRKPSGGSMGPTVGEDSSAKLQYAHNGKSATVTYEFAKGSELKIEAGSLTNYSFAIDTNAFRPGKDYPLTVSLAAANVIWTDAEGGAPLNGTAAIGLPLSGKTTVKY